ncbi:MAG: aminoacyl-tRNA hydrolase [Candidatus Pacebacteria bacterium]|nr:aminoacyl-tRNA hydrolase [Candidatus Paceibacterota bacterium]
MFLIVGLGNPGLKFKKTRHNIGFRVLDALQKENNFPKFKLNKKAKVEVTKGEINNKVIFLAKPQTYMNNSGQAVKFLLKESGFTENSLIIVHDDFDLPCGEIKIVENSGSGGHHGIESIIQSLGTKNFKRLKIGVRPTIETSGGASPVNLKAEDFVLKKFSKNEESHLAEVIKNATTQHALFL